MEKPDIRRLSDLAFQGDKAALAELVEWGLDEVLLQHIGEGFLPLWVQVRLKRKLDELQRRRASAHQRGALVRQIRTAKLEEIVVNAIENHRAPLLVKNSWERASWLRARIVMRPGDYGVAMRPGEPGPKKVPDIRVVRHVLKKMGFWLRTYPRAEPEGLPSPGEPSLKEPTHGQS